MCGGSNVPITLFLDDLEEPTSGNWTRRRPTGTTRRRPTRTTTFDPTYATSFTTNFWGEDIEPAVASYSIAMARDVDIPAGSDAHLRFNHAYGFEDDSFGAYDGGVLEYSTNGGASWTDAGRC